MFIAPEVVLLGLLKGPKAKSTGKRKDVCVNHDSVVTEVSS